MRYTCGDEFVIQIRRANRKGYSFVDDAGEAIASGPENGVVTRINYCPHGSDSLVSVAGRLYSRDQSCLFSSENNPRRTFTAPRSLTTIHGKAFRDNEDIRSVRLSAQTKTLHPFCFRDSSLRKIVLGEA